MAMYNKLVSLTFIFWDNKHEKLVAALTTHKH